MVLRPRASRVLEVRLDLPQPTEVSLRREDLGDAPNALDIGPSRHQTDALLEFGKKAFDPFGRDEGRRFVTTD